jgi:hypothetical protein
MARTATKHALHRGDLVSVSSGDLPTTAVVEGFARSTRRVPVRRPDPLKSDQVLWYAESHLSRIHCPHAVISEDSWVLAEPQWVLSRNEYEQRPSRRTRVVQVPGIKDWRLRIAEPAHLIYKGSSETPAARVHRAFGDMLEITDTTGQIMATLTAIRAQTWHLAVTGCDIAIVPGPRRAYQLIFGLDIHVRANPSADDRPLTELMAQRDQRGLTGEEKADESNGQELGGQTAR